MPNVSMYIPDPLYAALLKLSEKSGHKVGTLAARLVAEMAGPSRHPMDGLDIEGGGTGSDGSRLMLDLITSRGEMNTADLAAGLQVDIGRCYLMLLTMLRVGRVGVVPSSTDGLIRNYRWTPAGRA